MAEWQTRQLEGLVAFRLCRFKSCPGHCRILAFSFDAAQVRGIKNALLRCSPHVVFAARLGRREGKILFNGGSPPAWQTKKNQRR